ncbi:MAG: dTDP-4-dehydrorhamnose reductase [Planctomycetota bacterium]|jgi:dTDP-4-dehydrorhamnose reductase
MGDEAVVILGGRGMLGSDLASACKQSFSTVVFDLPDLDITNYKQLEWVIKDASIVLNCAAYTNVDGAESKADLAYKVNAEAVGQLGDLAKKAGVWVVHISTNFVFDGKSDTPYVETDPPNPINAYGKSKLAGEQLLVESGCRHCIMRIEWTYGLHGDNFVTKLIRRAEASKELKVVDDQIGSPTATTEVAGTICKLLSRRPEGIFHFASDGYVSRHEMAKFVFDIISMDVNILPYKSSDCVTPAERPLSSRFDCCKIKALLEGPIEPWQGPLDSFLRKL